MRNRNSLIRECREAFRDARLIVIASEGKDTERIYFKALAKEYANPRVHVHILEGCEGEQNNSSPEHVLKQLNDYKGQYDLESDDELWLLLHLVDATLLTPEEQQIWIENRRKSKNLNPYLKVLLRQKMGSYHEADYDALMLIKHVEVAIKRAKVLDKNPADRWPQTIGTRVYLLAESVMNRN